MSDTVKPYYWHQTEEHIEAGRVSAALFAYQEFIRNRDKSDDDTWRRIYGMRCDVGMIEGWQKSSMNYKDGLLREDEARDKRGTDNSNTARNLIENAVLEANNLNEIS